ncbi:MAG: MFS transporter [Microbacterium sp.]
MSPGVAAFLAVGLPAGAWIDRMRKRHVMIGADLMRALALSVIPVLWLLGVLQIWHLIIVALVVGIATVFFDVSYQSIIPSLVESDQIADHDPEIDEGLRWVFGNPLLRRIVGTTAISNLFGTVTFTRLPLFLLRHLGFSVEAMGVILSLSAIGGVVGALATPRIVAVIGEARAIPVSAIAFSVTAVFVPIAASVPDVAFALLVVQGFITSFTVLRYNITQVTFRQRITPSRLLGRMNASIRFVVSGVMPLAALAAGSLGAWLGVLPTMWIDAAGSLASALFVVVGPFWRMRDLPTAAE